MSKVFELSAQDFNLKLAEALKKIPEIKQPEWIEFVKSGASKQRPIDEPYFWYKRAASMLRQLYIKGTVGVNRFRTKYGSKKNRGFNPEEFRKAGGKIIRTILQQCDAAGFTEMVKPIRGIRARSGRKLTEKGKRFLEEIK